MSNPESPSNLQVDGLSVGDSDAAKQARIVLLGVPFPYVLPSLFFFVVWTSEQIFYSDRHTWDPRGDDITLWSLERNSRLYDEQGSRPWS